MQLKIECNMSESSDQKEEVHDRSIRDAISCKFPARARCRIACSAPWTCRSSTIAAREFAELGKAVFAGCQKIFKTSGPVIIFPSSGTGAWEAAIVNTLSPGDKVLMVETGHFATLWRQMAARWGIEVDFMPGDWRHGADPAAIEARLAQDTAHAIKAVMVVHNETSTGVTSRVGEIRAAMDRSAIPRCCWWIRSPRSARSTTATTSGRSTSPSAVRRRA